MSGSILTAFVVTTQWRHEASCKVRRFPTKNRRLESNVRCITNFKTCGWATNYTRQKNCEHFHLGHCLSCQHLNVKNLLTIIPNPTNLNSDPNPKPDHNLITLVETSTSHSSHSWYWVVCLWPMSHVTHDPCDPWHTWPITHVTPDTRDPWSEWPMTNVTHNQSDP